MAKKSEQTRDEKVSDQHEAFCQEYLKDLNQTQAAVRAGYSPDSAHNQAYRLLKLPSIQTRIEELMRERAERTRIDADYVLTTIRDTVERCRQAEPAKDRMGNPILIKGANGDLVPAYFFDATNVLKGSELLGKHLKLFTEKHEVTGKDGNPIELRAAQMSDEEIEAKLQGLLAKTKGKLLE